MPKFTFGDIEKRDLVQLADYFSKLTGSGTIMPDEELENWLRAQADAPKRDAQSILLDIEDEDGGSQTEGEGG